MSLFINGNRLIDEKNIKGNISEEPNNTVKDFFTNNKPGFELKIGDHKSMNLGNMDAGGFSPNIGFGYDNVRGTLSISFSSPDSVISGGDINSGKTWSEHVAWKSDIEKLQNEVDQLKKQISGGGK